ncbi:MAG: hypothetical protein GXP27_14605 [Planctomycetes bacterium]|nr:hypothetical protein [Planctomycetota bacterium]
MRKTGPISSFCVRMIGVFGVAVFFGVAARGDDTNVTLTGREPVIKITGQRTHLELVERSAKILELKSKITRVDGFDDTVINVKALAPNRIYVWAAQQGVTTVNITDESNETFAIDIFVKGDVRYLQALIDSNFPDASVEALKVNESSVVLRGWVTQPEQINYIVEIAEQFFPQVLNQMRVGGEQQVKLKVKVMEVQRSKIRQLGFNFLYLNKNGYLSSTPGQLTEVGEINLPFKPGNPGVVFTPDSLAEAAISFGLIGDHNIFNGFFQALKEEGLLKILAEPTVVTTNGRPATLLSGGEFPILVPQSLGTVSIEWREFGTRLEAVPIILGNGRLRLELQPEVSERDFSNAVSVGGLTVPGLTTRRVNTQVEMRFGQTLIIGGLIANRRTAETDKIPILGELPWIGMAFRRVRYDDVETELIIMVTPELVAPLDPDQVPVGGPGLNTDTPTDRELFIDGLLEVPNFAPGEDEIVPMSWQTPDSASEVCPQCLSDPNHHHHSVAEQERTQPAPLAPYEEMPPAPPSGRANDTDDTVRPAPPSPAPAEPDTMSTPPKKQASKTRPGLSWARPFGHLRKLIGPSEVRQASHTETGSKRTSQSLPISTSAAGHARLGSSSSTHRKRPGLIEPNVTDGAQPTTGHSRPALISPSLN